MPENVRVTLVSTVGGYTCIMYNTDVNIFNIFMFCHFIIHIKIGAGPFSKSSCMHDTQHHNVCNGKSVWQQQNNKKDYGLFLKPLQHIVQ